MGVNGGEIALTDDPRAGGYVRAHGLWIGPLPAGMAPANTAVRWGGRSWAMVVLPVPVDSVAATRLLLHEVWHVAQPSLLPLPLASEGGALSAQLDEPMGRTWLQLEWRALARALESSGTVEREAIDHALLFRARRYAAAPPAEQARQRLLDLSEGLAEYSAWKLMGSDVRSLAGMIRDVAPAARSFIRSFPYYTGPAYAFLLDRHAPGWIAKLRTTPDLQSLLARALHGERASVIAALTGAALDTGRLAQSAERAGAAYGLAALRQAEDTRWADRQRQIAELRARFVDGPTLRLRPGALRISFDPSRQTALGESGTVMGNLLWRGADGAELSAPEGALVTADWSEIRVPMSSVTFTAGQLTRAHEWSAPGWTLRLPPGWRLAQEGASWVAQR